MLNQFYKTQLSLHYIHYSGSKTLAVKCKIVYSRPLKKGRGKHGLVLVGDPYNYTAISLVDLFGIKEYTISSYIWMALILYIVAHLKYLYSLT